jgi:hypothetical protein
MSRANFDYRHVWAPTLMVATPIVHDPRGLDRYLEDRWEQRAACGMQVVFRGRYDPSDERPLRRRRLLDWQEYGAHLYADHAAAIGARWCKRCFPSDAP